MTIEEQLSLLAKEVLTAMERQRVLSAAAVEWHRRRHIAYFGFATNRPYVWVRGPTVTRLLG